jgi:hypothetical protein
MTVLAVVGKNGHRLPGEMMFGSSILKLLLLWSLIDYKAQVVL